MVLTRLGLRATLPVIVHRQRVLRAASSVPPTASEGLRTVARRPLIAVAMAATVATSGAQATPVFKDNRRMLHAVFRVGDLDASIDFYKVLGMRLLRKRDIPDEKYTNAFVGFNDEASGFALELTYNYGVDKYDLGDGFGHFGIAVEDAAATVEAVRKAGGKVTREAGPVKGGNTVIAFVEDPTGYKFELIQRKPPFKEPLCQIMLRTGNLQRSIDYYRNALGMTLLRTRDNPEQKYTLAFMGYGPEEDTTVIELTYNYDKTSYSLGNAYAQVAIGTDDVFKSAEGIRASGLGKLSREPGALPGLGTKITATLDPDGWKSVLVDNMDFQKELDLAAKEK